MRRTVLKNGTAEVTQPEASLTQDAAPKVRADESEEQTRGKRVSSRRGSSGDLIIFGPPGTGKTRTLVELAREGGGPVTFCSHARATARAAVQSVGEVPKDWTVGTIHSLCFRRLGLSRAQVVADVNLAAYCKVTGQSLDHDDEKPTEIRFYLHCHGFARSRSIHPSEAFDLCGALGSRTEFDNFCRTYDQWRHTYGFVDYTDMLTLCAERGFEYGIGTLVVDEAQDLTPLHWRVVEQLSKKASKVLVAGDDDQAIYEWAGADPHGMANFAERHRVETRVLAQSWRIPSRVHELAMRIAARIRKRIPKLYQPRPETGTIIRTGHLTKDLLREVYRQGTVMMLFRNKYMRASYERLLQEARVPYVTERGTSPLQKRAGKAYGLLQQGRWQEPEDLRAIRNALTPHGLDLSNTTDYETVADAVVNGRRPTDVLKCTAPEMAYLRDVRHGAAPIDMRTIHASKGLEADSVIVVTSLTKKSIESVYQDPDAEHRVHYVAATRAKHRLVIIEENAAYDFPPA